MYHVEKKQHHKFIIKKTLEYNAQTGYRKLQIIMLQYFLTFEFWPNQPG